MKCRDDCHNYTMDQFIQPNLKQLIQFYEMKENGTKIDGVTNEEVLAVLLHRLSVLNSKFPCSENYRAITNLENALIWLENRTQDRVLRKVEGTHKQ